MADVIHGSEVKIIYSGVTIAGAKNATITIDKPSTDTTELGNSGWRTRRPGKLKDWKIDVDGLSLRGNTDGYTEYLINEIKNTDDLVTVSYKKEVDGDKYEEGSATIVSFSESVSADGDETFNISLEGSGALETKTYSA